MATLTVDTSDALRLAAEFGGVAGQVGAKTAQLVRRTAYLIQRDAQLLSPVDTGFLRASISTTFIGDGRNAQMAAEIGPTAEYGVHVEYGTSRNAPQPYLAPAFTRHVDNFQAGLVSIAEMRG